MSRIHAFCKASIAPVRAEASDRSELVTQLLFGELVEITEVQDNWLKIRSFMDGYEGWMDPKQLQDLREKEFSRWLDGLVVEHSEFRIVEGPEGKQILPKGFFRPADADETFTIGKSTYSFLNEEEEMPTSRIDFAQSYLNAPYLWGGKTMFGVDCSGLMQQVHRVFNYQLPRDASQQVEMGLEIDFEDREAGDLAFFISDSGTIHHVGLLVNKDEIIHAHGYVRIDDFNSRGIIRKIDEVNSHKLHSIKRL
ncbi:NlpC/P60 family protein [Fluviicola taffensis]|uniref:NLP/P60 protein n=1 Tax=Fluviicola taffensis (strain DSM 16823 / NCIMB 13979 / RW262) TaxID=755732 RepID=F2ID16_FLUTR|nr:NlpC/P60 family protein [Fluviicola taffensis]AEA44410.1 NLP/P60 protein [Fluviicola taffensis DSM 16823]